jgi:hypothetical protein
MVTINSATNPLLPLNGAAFIRFALEVIDLLRRSEPHGLDESDFMQRYFAGNPPSIPQVRQHWWGEFKRSVDYSNRHFNKADDTDDGWAWIRARPGRQPGQYFYHVVAIRDGTRARVVEHEASLQRLEPFTTTRWLTQTRSRMRVRAAEGLSLLEAGRQSGNAQLETRGHAILDEFTMLSPRLAAINFDTGLVTQDLYQLAQSTDPRIRKVLGLRIKRALQSARRLERDVNSVAEQVLRLAQVYRLGSPPALP